MEQQEKQFDAVLKKSVAMFAMLTGKPMTEREGRAFIEIFDMTEAYLANGVQTGAAAETFDILSQVSGPTDDQTSRKLAELVKIPPQFVGRTVDDDTTIAPLPEISIDPATLGGDHSVTAVVSTAEDGQKTVTVVDIGREADIDAAWQQRAIEQARESDFIEQDLRARAASAERNRYVETTSRDKHPVGYDWQICALCRVGSRENSIVRCFKSEPTPEEFFELYRLYDAHTHWVFINRWSGGAQCWEKHLDEYMQKHDQALRNLRGTLAPKGIKVSKGDAPRALNLIAIANAGWEKPEFAWCIGRKDGFKQYQGSEPTRVELVKASTTKYIATKQKRPEIYL